MPVKFRPNEETVYQKIVEYVGADTRMDGVASHSVKKLSKDDLADYGLALSNHKTFWKILKSIPILKKVANRHLRGNTVDLLSRKNFSVAEVLFGIQDKKEFSRLQKQGFVPKYEVLTDKRQDLQQSILRAHHCYQFVKACKDDGHWIHKAMGPTAKAYARIDLSDIKTDFSQFDRVLGVVDSWDTLGGLEDKAGEGFPLLWTMSAGAGGVPKMDKLSHLVDLYSNIQGGTAAERASLAITFDQAVDQGKAYFPPVVSNLWQPVSFTDAQNRVNSLLATNNAVDEMSRQHNYHDVGQVDAFQAFVSKAIEGIVTLDAIPQRMSGYAQEFNKESYEQFRERLDAQYGKALMDPIGSVMEAQEFLLNGERHYSQIAGFQEIAIHLEELASARQTFINYGLEESFLIAVRQKMVSGAWANMTEAGVAIGALAKELHKLEEALGELASLRGEFEAHGIGAMFSQILAAQVSDLRDRISEEGIQEITSNLKAVLNREILQQFLKQRSVEYGEELSVAIGRKIQQDDEVRHGLVRYDKSDTYRNVMSELTMLNELYAPFVDEFPPEQLAAILNTVERQRRADGEPTLLSDLGSPQLSQDLVRHFNSALWNKRIAEYTDVYGESLRPFILAYLKDHDPQVLVGDKKYDESAFFKATMIEEQIALLEPYILKKYPTIDSVFLDEILMSPSETPSLEGRLQELKTVHEWTLYLAPNPDHQVKRQLAQHFALALGNKYLDGHPDDSSTAEEIDWIFRFAIDVSKKNVYSADVIAAGMRRFLDNKAASRDDALFAGAGLPEGATTGWFRVVSESEKRFFAHCLSAHTVIAMREYCVSQGRVFGADEEGFANLFATKFLETNSLPNNPDFTLPYVTALSQSAMGVYLDHVMTPGQAAAYFEQAARGHRSVVSLNLKQIDQELSKNPLDVMTSLPIALDSIERGFSRQADVTFGDVFKLARKKTGVATAAMFRAMIEDRLPPTSKGEVKHIERLLKVVEEVISTSKFSDIDKILDKQDNHQSAEKVRIIMDLAQTFMGLTYVDDVVNPQVKDKVHGWMDREFALELAKLRALPDSTNSTPQVQVRDPNISTLMEMKDAPIVVFGVVEALQQIEQARSWRRALQSGEIKTLPPEAPGFSVFMLEILPKILPWLKRKSTMKMALWAATSAPGKMLIPFATGPFLRLFGRNINAEQRQAIVTGLPGLLRVVSKMDLTGPKNQQTIDKLVKVLDVLKDAVDSTEEVNVKEFSITLMEAVAEMTPELADQTDMAFVAFRQMARHPS
ncbi:MAG: hypothetical protein Q8K75_00745 [Chlamydiales bacterium]|nr:hypothetical protein [Chlamydiales bacterium]